ncbi:ATP-binding cassette domain-containing protein [Pedobacter sp. MC2016-14]|uniref:ATP-binding cassette domain-containing protein n=1 Tax=Pedobacter sp. MC2016-14 TaxID=2897327 RepID=UPI001E4E9719|nr:ATP-binding cassette domain-containing protein [Pedobacter sp. MC2016-14]MCD0490059.1 ATP-binding cassette domain-containing protein [Pedobacter sp. MC2016-14]
MDLYGHYELSDGFYFFHGMNELNVDSVRKEIDGRQILNDIFISCSPGQIVGLLGRNGSGKSTLLKIIFGSLAADNKFIRIDGKKINSISDHKGFLGYLPQDSFLPDHIKIKNIIACSCSKEHADVIMDYDLIKPILQQKPKQLSGGERRVLEILLMIHSNAKYLLFDEPFNGISPIYVELIQEIIKKHSVRKGFIITDHDYRNVLAISSKVILLDNGNTKLIKNFSQLIDLGYLPPNRDYSHEHIQHPYSTGEKPD